MLKKISYIILSCMGISVLIMIFKGFNISNFINYLFMFGILTLSYGFFKLMNERKIFRTFGYSMKRMRSFFNLFVGDKNAYVEKVEREAFGQSEDTKSDASNIEEFMLADVPKDELTMPMVIAGVIMMLLTIASGFFMST